MNPISVLLVDDDEDSREVMKDFLKGIMQFEVEAFTNGEEALRAFNDANFDLVLADIKMPKMNGIELLKNIRQTEKGKNCPFILMTAFADVKSAVDALKFHATDYLIKPVDISQLNEIITKLLVENNNDQSDIVEDNRNQIGNFLYVPKIGKIGVFSESFRQAIKFANIYNEDRTVNVLIEGESGTGKEIIANLIHGIDNTKPFVTINCSAISPNLFESELFGYVGGAFTGARSSGLAGKFELANGGTLFLDEIGEMPLEMQPKLLRAIQERELYRIGGQKPISIDVRVICATNRNLEEFVNQGKFRADLYHRIKVGYIQLKPLNQQKESIIPLAKMFLEEYSLKRGKQFQRISPAAIDLLLNYEWKGNVRELANAIDRAVLHNNAIELSARHLSFLDENYSTNSSFVLTPNADFQLPENGLNLEELEREIVRRTLKKFRGNKTKTAEFLGLTRSALRSRM